MDEHGTLREGDRPAACRGPVRDVRIGRIEQRGILVGEKPDLRPRDHGREPAEQAAGAASEVEQARARGQVRDQRRGQCGAAGGGVERLAQRERVRVEGLAHASASAKARACVSQEGRAWPRCQAASAMSWRSARSKIGRRSAFESWSRSPTGTTIPASGVTSAPAAAARGDRDGQAALQRFRDGHAVALPLRREREEIGTAPQRVERGVVGLAGEAHEPRDSELVGEGAKLRRMGGRAAVVAHDGQGPVEIEEAGERAQQQVVALARHQRAHREDGAAGAAGAFAARGGIGAGHHHGASLRRHAEILGETGCDGRAGHDGAAQAGQQRALDVSQPLRRLRLAPGPERGGVVDEPDGAPGKRVAKGQESGQAESVDDRNRIRRERVPGRACAALRRVIRERMAPGELDHLHVMTERAQSRDHAAIVGVAARDRAGRRRHEERDAHQRSGRSGGPAAPGLGARAASASCGSAFMRSRHSTRRMFRLIRPGRRA